MPALQPPAEVEADEGGQPGDAERRQPAAGKPAEDARRPAPQLADEPQDGHGEGQQGRPEEEGSQRQGRDRGEETEEPLAQAAGHPGGTGIPAGGRGRAADGRAADGRVADGRATAGRAGGRAPAEGRRPEGLPADEEPAGGPAARPADAAAAARRRAPSSRWPSATADVLDGRAGADQVAVAVGVVDPGHRRPELVLAHPRRREGRLLARVGALPRGGGHRSRGVRRVLERVVVRLLRPSSTSRISSRIAIIASQKRSSSALRLALGRLDHQRARHREGHRRRVEAVVHQALGDVLDLDAGLS